MKYLVRELKGALLDAAVAKAARVSGRIIDQSETTIAMSAPEEFRRADEGHYEDWAPWSPSTDWRIGGPIIDRECMRSSKYEAELYPGQPWHYWTPSNHFGHGPTPLMAAMRAYVASKLGDEVEIP